MKVFLYLLFFLQTAFLISCNTKRRDFTVKTPYGWEVKDSVSERFGRSVNMHPPVISTTPVFVENIIISIIQFPSLDIYRSTALKSIESESVYFEIKGEGRQSINNYEMEWEQHIIQHKKSDETVEQKVYFLSYKGNIYQIVCTTYAKQMKRFQFFIDQVLQSFKIID